MRVCLWVCITSSSSSSSVRVVYVVWIASPVGVRWFSAIHLLRSSPPTNQMVAQQVKPRWPLSQLDCVTPSSCQRDTECQIKRCVMISHAACVVWRDRHKLVWYQFCSSVHNRYWNSANSTKFGILKWVFTTNILIVTDTWWILNPFACSIFYLRVQELHLPACTTAP